MSDSETRHEPEDPLLEWIGTLLNGTATTEEQARLAERLTADAGARRTYCRYINLHVALSAYGAAPGGPLAGPFDAASSAPARGRKPLGLALTAVAAAVLVAAVVHWLPWKPEAPSGLVVPAAPIARISKAVGARWAAGSFAAGVDADLPASPLELAEGLVEIVFKQGARVVLEAPVQLELIDAGAARLTRGRVVVHVPPQARGFAVRTPQARLVDLGTEFGVSVRGEGDTEVQVFQGAVVASWTGAVGQTVDQRLEAGRAVRIRAQAPDSQGIPFEPEHFVRMFPADSDCGNPGGPLYNRSRLDTVHVLPAPKNIIIDGDLSDWDRRGTFYSACLPPYHESHYLEGAMMYDELNLYVGAHVGDPAPMRSVMDPSADPSQFPWRGGSVIVRLTTSPTQGWPVDAIGAPEGAAHGHPEWGHRPQDVSEHIVHLVMWYHRPSGKPRLEISFGMDFHGGPNTPAGWRGAFRRDPNGSGYTLEYAIPWTLLRASQRPPQPGDILGATWTVHWSDQEGRISRGHLVEITNLQAQPYQFLQARTWGRAVYHRRSDRVPDQPSTPPGAASP
jgi:ferric-dicitrate binding protein FerR (iron transport regulator)